MNEIPLDTIQEQRQLNLANLLPGTNSEMTTLFKPIYSSTMNTIC